MIRIHHLNVDRPLGRVNRPLTLTVTLQNLDSAPASLSLELHLPPGVKSVAPLARPALRMSGDEERTLIWRLQADQPTAGDLKLEVKLNNATIADASLWINFLPAVETSKQSYIPPPAPVKTSLLIGAHNCPLWESDQPGMWSQILKHPERTPALGFYGQENPEVADWETKWALEHGVSFFIYCWYRASQGEPVITRFSSAIHDALFKSKYGDQMKFTIMWENQARGVAGVADEKDLMTNLLPFWIKNYFTRPNYLKVDNKPVLFIYRPEFLIDDLGSVENVVRAFDKMRQACKEAGFDGLYLLGEYRGFDPAHLRLMKSLGLDYTFAYCWYVPNNPTPEQSIQAQMQYIRATQSLGILPQVVTVSQAWSGWADEGTIWKIPPTDFERLLRQAKEFVETLPPQEIGSKMLLLDNWNEWGEGHYIAPYREYGFGYLDAVRRVFSAAPEKHLDLLPEDIGMGPYDTAYRRQAERKEQLRRQAAKPMRKPGSDAPGLIGWWAFDEEQENPVGYDYSGNRLGGTLMKATRAPGLEGNALVCNGGGMVVEYNALLSPTDALTLECWVKTDLAGQDNRWIINRVYSGGINTGYRLGVLEGKPCFEVPFTDWSHHLTGSKLLPTGRWVHLAGTFDGKTMRLYMDGEECGAMDRPGPIHANAFPLTLGTYEAGHIAYFTGLLDEVKLYRRALSASEIQASYRRFANRAGR
jgi:hypothetical protein